MALGSQPRLGPSVGGRSTLDPQPSRASTALQVLLQRRVVACRAGLLHIWFSCAGGAGLRRRRLSGAKQRQKSALDGGQAEDHTEAVRSRMTVRCRRRQACRLLPKSSYYMAPPSARTSGSCLPAEPEGSDGTRVMAGLIFFALRRCVEDLGQALAEPIKSPLALG